MNRVPDGDQRRATKAGMLVGVNVFHAWSDTSGVWQLVWQERTEAEDGPARLADEDCPSIKE
jgi:hypothetical protein